MGKKAKEHRKKVAKRNNLIAQERKRFEKMQKEMLMKLIEEEKQKGLFNNPVSTSNLDLPTIGLPITEGPSLGLNTGPVL